jgi:hypothetical protein
LSSTLKHVANPLVLANFLIAPLAVSTSMMPYFIHEAGMEPYNEQNPVGTRWKKFMHGVRVVLKREPTLKEEALNKALGKDRDGTPQSQGLEPGKTLNLNQ